MSEPFPNAELSGPHPFENLVLEGGGVKGIAYVGALKTLEKKGELAALKRVGGSSAGGITAMLLALGYTPDEIQLEMDSIEFNLLLDSRSKFWSKYPKWMDTKHQSIRKRLFKVESILLAFRKEKVGIYEGDIFLQWAKAKITAKLGNPNATFGDLKEAMDLDPSLGFKELMLTATNISGPGRDILRCFDAEMTPNVRIADALRATMSFPGAFETYDIEVNGVTASYVDGGVANNFPMEYYDHKKFMPQNGELNDMGVNPYTLGLRIDTKEEIDNFKYGPVRPSREDKNFVHSWIGFAYGMIQATRSDRDKVYQKYPFHTIQIQDNGISTLDFDLDERAKQGLIKQGENAVDEWHRLYRKGVQGFEKKTDTISDDELIKMYEDYEQQLAEDKEMEDEKRAALIRKRDAIKAIRPQIFNKTSEERALESIKALVDLKIDYAHASYAFLYSNYIKLENLIEVGRLKLNEQNDALNMLQGFSRESDMHQFMVQICEEVERLQFSLNEKISAYDKKDHEIKEKEPKALFDAKLIIEFQFEKTRILEKLRHKLFEENTLKTKHKNFLLNMLKIQLDKAQQGNLYQHPPHETYYEKYLSVLKSEGEIFEKELHELRTREEECAEQLKVQKKKLDTLHRRRLKNGDDFDSMFQLSNQLKVFINEQDSLFLSAQKLLRGALQVCTLYLPVKFLATRLFKVNADHFEGFENRFISNQELYRKNAIILQSNLQKCLNNWQVDAPEGNASKYLKLLKNTKENIESISKPTFKLPPKSTAVKKELLDIIDAKLSDVKMEKEFHEMIDELLGPQVTRKKEDIKKYIETIKIRKEEVRQLLLQRFPSSEQRKGGRIEHILLPFTRKIEELERSKSLKMPKSKY